MYKKKITTRQMILIMVIFRLTFTISHMPATELPPANQDVWMVLIVALLYTVAMRIPLLYLANKFKDITMMEYQEKILGSFFGKFIGFLYGLYFGFNAIYILSLYSKIIGVNVLPRSQYWIIVIPAIILSIYVGSKGLIVILRSGELFAPVILVSIISLILLGLQNADFSILLPILADSTFKEINIGAILLSFILTDIFILIMCTPFLENKKDINKIFVKVNIYSEFLSIIAIVATQAALGIEQTKHTNFPFLVYTRLINYKAIFQRIDSLYVIVLLSSNIGRIIIYIYFSHMAFKSVFNVRNGQPILYITATVVGLIALYISNIGISIMTRSPFTKLFTYISAVFLSIIPLFIMIVYFFRRKTINREEKLENE